MFHLLLGPVLAGLLGASDVKQDPIEVPVGERQLFLDDYDVAEIQGLRRTMHVPEKKGAVVCPDQPWEIWLQTRCMPAWDEEHKIFKMWLLGCVPTPIEGTTNYVESTDGIHWTKPVLRQKKYKDSLENNLMGPPVTVNPCVIYDPDDADPGRRFKGLFFEHDRSMRPNVSEDGIHWKRLDVPKLPSMDESNLSYDRANRTFIATLKLDGPHGRSHAIWTSKDFNTWTNTKVVFSADDLDQTLGRKQIEECLSDPTRRHPEYNVPATYNVDVYNLGLFRYEGLYIGMPAMYHQTGKVTKDWPGFDEMSMPEDTRKMVRTHGDWAGFHHVQLACSRDLHQWVRLGNRKPFLDLSPETGDAYDTQVILPPSDALVRGDELWFYYTGMRSYGMVSNKLSDQGAICLAVLRRDGFVSLDADATPGTLTTKPFVVHGTMLFVNVDANGSACDIELLGIDGKPLAVSRSLTGDQPRAEVSWKSGSLADMQDQTVQLRFTLKGAKLYSFWLDK